MERLHEAERFARSQTDGSKLTGARKNHHQGSSGLRRGGPLLTGTNTKTAEALRVHSETVRQWIRDGELIAVDISKEYRILQSDLDAFIASRRGRTKRRKKTRQGDANSPVEKE